MKKLTFSIITFIIALFGSLLVAEFLIYLKHSQFKTAVGLYNSGNKNNFGNKFHHRNDKDCNWIKSLYPHPYFGITHSNQQACKLKDVNKQGTTGPSFPTTRDNEYFDILFLGGSVAFNIIDAPIESGGKSYLRHKLESSYRDLNNRKIRIYNGALVSWKQPQQLFFFLTYAQSFDAVISLEGVNEFTIPPSYALDLPFDITFNQIRLPDVHNSMDYSINSILAKLRSYFMFSYTFNFLEMKHNEYINRKYSYNRDKSFLYKMYKEKKQNVMEHEKERIKKYFHYLTVLTTTAKNLNQKWLIFFQPFLEYKKIPHANEKKYYINNSFLKKSYPTAVKYLVAKEELHAISLLDLFSQNSNEIYSDYVHFRRDAKGISTGHIKISDTIIESVVSRWGLKKI